MADTKTTAEAAASALGGTELVRGVQSAANVKVTIDQIKDYVFSASFTVIGSVTTSGVVIGTHVVVPSASLIYWTARSIINSPSDGVVVMTNQAQDTYVTLQVGPVQGMKGTAIPAGGTAGAGLLVSSTANFGVFFGSGAPTLSAAKGSLYLRSDGSGIADRAYINTNGTTTWTALATAA